MKAAQIIDAANKVNGSVMDYSAGNAVLLKPGFEATTGSVFKAEIGGWVSKE